MRETEEKNKYTIGARLNRPYHINQMTSPLELRRAMLEQEQLDIPVAETTEALVRPVRVGSRVIPNAMAVHPVEGFDATEEGNPSERTRRRYLRYASGGAGLIWFETFGISDDSRDGPRQLMLRESNIPELRRLIRDMDMAAEEEFGDGHRPYKVAQISHSGRRTVDQYNNATPINCAFSPYFDYPQSGRLWMADDVYIEHTIQNYIETAVHAMETGFDGVDVKPCHSYFISDLLSAFERPGRYGGSFENRTRALLEIVDGIRERCGDGIDMCFRMNAYDAIPYPHGWGMVPEYGVMAPDLTEPVRLLKLLRDRGVKMINVSTSVSRYAPYGEGLFAQSSKAQTDQYKGVYCLLEATRSFKQQVPELLYVATGLTHFEQYSAHVGAGGIEEGWFDIAGYGRQALAYPDFARDILTDGALDKNKVCLLCDMCHELSMNGHTFVGCVARDKEDYQKLYREKVLGREEKC